MDIRKMWAAKGVNKSASSSRNPHFNQESSNPIKLNTSSVENDTVRREVDLDSLPVDPGERKPMLEYHCNDRDIIRRAYIQKGPYQPKNHKFPQRKIGGVNRRFVKEWFHTWGSWLEYSPKKDAAFCLCCYLFMNPSLGHGGGDVFSTIWFNSWNKTDRFSMHVGGPSSVHNKCFKMSEELMIQKQSIQTALQNQSNQQKNAYRTRLNASIDVVRLLLVCGLPFRGHDESEASRRKGNFLTILNWYAERVDDVGAVVLKNAAQNLQMTSPKIQKDIVNACAKETVKAIIEDLRDDYFSILVDESRDVSHKEQMAIVLRYVDRRGLVMERFIAIVHVAHSSALSLKEAIYSVLSQHSLSPCRIRDQGYDGASNMQGHLNGLKTLIMKDSEGAHNIHCFAHQLQLTLVTVAKNHDDVEWLFELISILLNVIGASFKHRDKLREKQAEEIAKELQMGEIATGRGLNQ